MHIFKYTYIILILFISDQIVKSNVKKEKFSFHSITIFQKDIYYTIILYN